LEGVFRKMKIALIGQSFDKNSGQGIYKFSSYLYENLKKINKNTNKIEIGISKSSSRTIFNNIFMSFFKTIKTKYDVYHFMMPEIALPCIFKKPSVVTVHDLIPLIIKSERKSSFNFYFKFMMKMAKRASHFIANSKSTKNDLIGLLKIPERKISVTYLGVDHKKFFPLKKKKHKKFIIGYVGGLGKRKNVEMLLKVAKKLENENVLIKIAGKGPQLNKLTRIKNQLNLKNVEFVGFIPENELNEFYNSLDLFIFPSLYEGFGLPVLEAMACGVPIIASNTSSLPEIVGGAGILVDPNGTDEIAEAVERVMKDSSLREKMAKRGLERAKTFSWEKTAKETLKVYERIC